MEEEELECLWPELVECLELLDLLGSLELDELLLWEELEDLEGSLEELEEDLEGSLEELDEDLWELEE